MFLTIPQPLQPRRTRGFASSAHHTNHTHQIPGLIHAWYIIAKYPDTLDYEPLDQEQAGRVTYVVISDSPRPSPAPQSRPQQAHPSYGTTAQHGGHHDAGQGGSSQACPPSYAEVVAGDNKIQSP